MNPKIPSDASPETKECFRLLWVELEKLGGSNNIDLHRRRIINAGESVNPGDYVTRGELTAATGVPLTEVFTAALEAADDAASTGGVLALIVASLRT